MEMREMTLAAFTDALASKQAVPGGGGASALAGALGAALGAMVGELTLGKPKYAAVEAEMASLTARARVDKTPPARIFPHPGQNSLDKGPRGWYIIQATKQDAVVSVLARPL